MNLGHVAFVSLVYVLAVMRVTRLVNSDTILDPFRVRLAKRFGPGSSIVYFLNCPWCVGMWVSLAGALGPILIFSLPWWTVFPIGLACSQLVGMASPLYSDDEIEFEPVQAV